MSNFNAASSIARTHYAELIKICSAFSDYTTYFTPKIRGLEDFYIFSLLPSRPNPANIPTAAV